MVGNGQRVGFWKDKWCGAAPLCVSFLALFVIAMSKEALVEDVWTASESEEKDWGGGGVGALVSLGLFMIERWVRWKIYYCVF